MIKNMININYKVIIKAFIKAYFKIIVRRSVAFIKS